MLEHGLGTWEEGDFRNHSQPSFKKGGADSLAQCLLIGSRPFVLF